MATFASDDFSEVVSTVVKGKALDVGGAWSTGALGGSNYDIRTDGSGGAYSSAVGSGTYGATIASGASVPSADYVVSATLNIKSVLSVNVATICARATTAGGNQGYILRYNGSAFSLGYLSAGAFSQLGSQVSFSLPAGSSVPIAIQVQGTTITAIVNGSVLITQTDSTYTAAGFPGIAFQNNGNPSGATSGQHISAFSAATIATNYSQSVGASTTLTAGVGKSFARNVTASLSSLTSLRRAISKPISASFVAVPSIAAGKRALAAISASFTGTATMTRAVGHLVTQTVSASFSTVASLTARLRANVSISAQVVPQVSISAGKAFRRTIAVAAPFSAFVGRIYAVTISAAFSGIASLFRASQAAPPPERLIQLGTQNRIIDLPAAENRIIDL